jgi:tRNA(fMet)-specific endonuclease VapC
MIYLLDTNAVIGLLRGRPAGLVSRVSGHRQSDIGLSSLVAHELYYGAFHGDNTERLLAGVDALPFATVPFEQADARASGRIRAELAAAGRSIGAIDVLLAGQALARGLVMVTHNVREFARVAGLRVEDWHG